MQKRYRQRWSPYHRPLTCVRQFRMAKDGYALPTAFALGLCMISMAITSVLLAQDGRDTARLRRDSSASVLIGDSAIAETLSMFSLRDNQILLGKNYDPINPGTGKVYLGVDGIPNSGDEDTTATDEWESSQPECASEIGLNPPSLSVSQTINPDSSYKILAYRFHPGQKRGDLLIKGTHQGISSYIHVNLDLRPNSLTFPGILVEESAFWQGRDVLGANGNLYFAPSYAADLGLSAKAASVDPDRDIYLNAIWSGHTDGFTSDEIQGKLVACSVSLAPVETSQGQDLGSIDASQTLSGNPGQITFYQTDGIDLNGTDELVIDTTSGPVHLYSHGSIILRDTAKIRNIRSDDLPPEVGDFRIIQTNDTYAPIALFDTTCIEQAYIYSPELDVQLLSTGDGCPGESNSNIIGVIWAEDIINSSNSATSRTFVDGTDDFVEFTSNVTTGIEVPEDVSSLMDILDPVNLPVLYSIRAINSWSEVGVYDGVPNAE